MATLSTPAVSQPNPSLTWYQQAWIGWPIFLVFAGGLIGGACGGAAWGINQAVFRKTENAFLRYVFTGMISVAAVIAYFVLAVSLLRILHR